MQRHTEDNPSVVVADTPPDVSPPSAGNPTIVTGFVSVSRLPKSRSRSPIGVSLLSDERTAADGGDGMDGQRHSHDRVDRAAAGLS